jgi:hypothetical protein
VAAPALSLVDRQISVRLFLLSFVCYAYFYAGGGWNQNAQFDLTRAIVERHTFALDGLQANSGDISTWGGHTYANKSPGASFLAAAPYTLLYAAERAGGTDPATSIVETFNCYVCTLFTCGLTGALIPMLLYRLARRRQVEPRWAAAVSLLLALGTQLWSYSTVLMAHVPSAALLFLAFALLPETNDQPVSPRRLVGAGLAAGTSALTNYLCVPALGVLGLLVILRRRRTGDSVRAASFFAIGVLPPLLALAVYQKITCGGFFRTPIDTMDARFVSTHAFLGILRLPQWDALWGITFSPYRGLFYFAPLLLTAIAGALFWNRSRRAIAELRLITLMIAFWILFNAGFNGWEGGFGIGSRYLVIAIPFLGLMILEVRGGLRRLVVAIGALSIFLNFAAVAVDPQPSGSIPRPMEQYILPLLFTGHFSSRVPITPPWSAATFTGHTSVNRVAADEPAPFVTAPPDGAASEWASFNLGEPFFGPGHATSLLPIVLIMIAGSAAIVRQASGG